MPNECEFLNLVNGRRAVIAVIGLGNTGLPVAQGYVARGFPVRGIDIDAGRVDELRHGRSYLAHISDQQVQTLTAGSFSASIDFCAVTDADVVIVCVPTPLDSDGAADLTSVRAAFDAIAPYVKPATLVMLQSTVPPGTTDAMATRLAAKSGLALGTELFVAFAPERIDPANSAGWSIVTTPRVVGGVTKACTRRASAVLEALCAKAVTVSDTRTAEVTKIVENTFRMVNIVLANEISDVCRDLGVSEREVVEAASTKPFGFLAHRPGPGIGGDCIPVTPAFLLADACRRGIPMPIVAAAYRQIALRPEQVVTRLTEALTRRHRRIDAAQVLVLGVSYKENVNDTRNAPALQIIERLLQLGAGVDYHDPLVPVLTVSGRRLESRPCGPHDLGFYDCAVLVTAHDEMLSRLDPAPFPLVLDTRHVLRQEGNVEWL
ncbi:MAG: nucleotide sugar dehydrogenase [Pseudonocardiaceae bacterium]